MSASEPTPAIPLRGGADARTGAAVYNPFVLAFYDVAVLRLNLPWVWRCPQARIARMYERFAAPRHAEVGTGTGFFPDRHRFAGGAPEALVLVDLNADVLAHASKRLARYRPETVLADALRPIPYDGAPLGSIAMCNLLHCVPGSFREKGVAFEHVAALGEPGTVVFGSTLFGSGVRATAVGRALLRLFNRTGVFSNRDDTPDALRSELDRRFDDVELEVVGSMGLFSGRIR